MLKHEDPFYGYIDWISAYSAVHKQKAMGEVIITKIIPLILDGEVILPSKSK